MGHSDGSSGTRAMIEIQMLLIEFQTRPRTLSGTGLKPFTGHTDAESDYVCPTYD